MRRRRGLIVLILLALLVLWVVGQRAPRPAADAPPVVMAPRPPVRPAPPAASAALDGPVDRITIDKSRRAMTAWRGDTPLRTYRIALGFAPAGTKVRQGDGRTPEGHFRIDRKNEGSAYHRSLGIDYPRPEDRARARAGGYSAGGDIFIHGQPNQRPDGEVLEGDWTAGCIAVSDAEIAALFAAAPIGAAVVIVP